MTARGKSSGVVAGSRRRSGGGFPSTPLIDVLTRVENPLSDGAKWTQPANPADASTISSTAAGASTGGVGYGSARRNDATYSDCEVYCTVVNPGSEIQLYFQVTADGYGYMVDFAGSTAYVFEIVAWGSSMITSFASGGVATNNVIGARKVGNVITVYKNGVVLGSVNDSTYATAGYLGFDVAGDSSIKNFGGGGIGGGGLNKHLGLIRFGGDVTSYASRISEYKIVCVSDGDTVGANPKTLLYANGMKIRTDGGSGANYSTFNSLGYSTGVATPGFPAYFAKVGNSAYRTWFAQQVRAMAVAQGAAGIFLDDLAMTAGTGNDTNTIFGLTLTQFQDAMVALAAAVGSECHSNGLYLLANCNAYISGVQDDATSEANWVGRHAASLDGAMNESFMTLRDGSNTIRTNALGATSAGWKDLVTLFEGHGVDCVGLTYGPLANAKYGYASMLTQATRAGSCFMWDGNGGDPVQLLDMYTGTASIDLVNGVGTVS